MTPSAHTTEKYRVVLRMRGMFPSDIAGYEAHRLRKRGDTEHVDKSRSLLNKPIIGNDDWAAQALEKIEEIKLQNFLDEVTSLRKRNRKKDAEVRHIEGPKDPWRPTRNGPLREIILTANKKYFEDEMAAFMGENREADFQACAKKWLEDEFGSDVVHARVDRDEAAFHVHAVLLPIQRVEMTRTDKETAEKKVIAVRHMLQPSKHALVKDYEKAQDSVGIAFQHLNLQRGECRAAAIRKARAAGQPVPKRRYHARTTQWRAEKELELADKEAKLVERSETLHHSETKAQERDDALSAREAEVDAIDAAIKGVETGVVTLDETGDTPALRPVDGKATAPDAQSVLASLRASPTGEKRAISLFGRLFGALMRKAKDEAERSLGRDVAELKTARDTLADVVARLGGDAAAAGQSALKSLTKSLLALRRHDSDDGQGEGKSPDRS